MNGILFNYCKTESKFLLFCETYTDKHKNWRKLFNKIKTSCLTKWSKVLSSGVTLTSGATLNSLTFSMESHWLVPITAILQGVCFLNRSLQVSARQPNPTPNFLNAPMTFDLLFLLKNFQIVNLMLWEEA